MPRPSNWNSPTTAIRIPAHAAEQLLAIARQLDSPSDGFVQNPSTPPLLISVDDTSGDNQYLIEAVQLSPEDDEAVELAIAQVDRSIDGERELLLFLAEFVKRTQTPIGGSGHANG